MKRREFIALASGAAAWPLFARAQQPAIPVVAFVQSGSSSPYMTHMARAFSQGLREVGYIESQNVAIEYHWGEGHNDRLPALMAELVSRRVAAILAAGGPAPGLAAKANTAKIPIVFISATDPVKAGLVSSYNRPGGNVTGVSMVSSTIEAKRLETLHELVPKASAIAAIINPNYPGVETRAEQLREAASHLDVKLVMLNVSSAADLDAAFASLVQQGASVLIVVQDPVFVNLQEQFVTLAARHGIPAIYSQRDYAVAGGLMSYGPDFADGFRQAGVYVGKILKGEKPTDLPVVEPTRYELIINLKTAKTLGINIPPAMLARADEVIE